MNKYIIADIKDRLEIIESRITEIEDANLLQELCNALDDLISDYLEQE